MREHTQSRIILSLLTGLILLAFCFPINVLADTTDLSDGDGTDISLSVTIAPSVKSGDGAVHYKGKTVGITFTTDDYKDNFLKILVDGKEVSAKSYTITGDSLAITLHADFLDGLALGDHTIEIVTVNGSATAKFSVSSAAIPSTGESFSSTSMVGLILIFVGTSVIVVNLSRKMKRKQSK